MKCGISVTNANSVSGSHTACVEFPDRTISILGQVLCLSPSSKIKSASEITSGTMSANRLPNASNTASGIVTTGAHTGGIMSLIGKIFGSKIIYIETFASINQKSITGRLVYKFADLFIVQHESMLKFYPKAVMGGWIF